MIAALCVTVAVSIAYWTIWFFVDRSWLATLDTPAYYAFENSFAAADTWLAVAAAASAWSLIKRRPAAMLWLIACGSACVYLGLMDVLFDLENQVYVAPPVDAVVTEVVINAGALGLGFWFLWYGWHHRRWFLAQPDAPAC